MAKAEVVQGLWVEGSLPIMQELSIASFLAHGHEYHLYTYDRSLRAPAGTIVCDASEILPEGRAIQNQHGYGAFSDCFRYRLLLERGGWWVDTDMVCLRPFDFDAGYLFCSEHLPEARGEFVPNSGVIRTPPQAAIIQYADQTCSGRDLETVEWAELGPALLRESIRRFSLDRYVMPPEAFCPVPWFHFRDFLDPELRLVFGPNTYAVHLWNAIWGRHGLDTNAAYHPRCAYEIWKRDYLSPARRCC